MASHLKKADPNHLVTIGGEGFYGPTSKKGAAVNPGNGWASITGQDFENNYRIKAVDFAVAHVWSDNWEVSNTARTRVTCADASGLPGSVLSVRLNSPLCPMQKHVCAALTPAAGPLQMPSVCEAGPLAAVPLGAWLASTHLSMAIPHNQEPCVLPMHRAWMHQSPGLASVAEAEALPMSLRRPMPQHLPSLL